ncbi:MAG: ATP-grasp domain-containing protein [Opitutales bacterium]
MSSRDTRSVPRILFTSLSKKISLYEAVQRQARNFHPQAELVGGDSDPLCLGRERIKLFVQTPSMETVSFEEFTTFCREQSITHLIPTRDGELDFFAKARPVLLLAGIHSMISPPEAIATCLDKFQFAQTAAGLGFSAIPTFESLDQLEASRVTVKERHGSGSSGVYLDLSAQEAAKRAIDLREPIFQPHVRGRELSADVYIDQSGQSRGVILRWRDLVINGESKITTTFRNPAWECKIEDLAVRIGLRGHALVQAIVDKDLQIHFLEINARLGGATSLALASGLRSIEWFLTEASGEILEPPPFDYQDGKRLTRNTEGRDQITEV